MALRAMYKGLKKVLTPLIIKRPGELAIDQDALNAELNKTFYPRSEQAVMGAVNIAPMSLAEMKTLNTTGSWADNVYTLNSGTITVNTDSNGNVIGLVAAGNPSATIPFFVTGNLGYTDAIRLVGCPSGGGTSTYKLCIVNTSGSIISDIEETGSGKNIQMSQTFRVQLRVYSGATIPAGGLIFKPMLTYNLNATYADFVPYVMTNAELMTEIAKKLYFATIFMPYSVSPVYTGDLDNLSTGCVYVGENADHSPSDWCVVYTVSASTIDMPDATYGFQLAIGVASQALFYRRKTGGTWSTWNQITMTAIA